MGNTQGTLGADNWRSDTIHRVCQKEKKKAIAKELWRLLRIKRGVKCNNLTRFMGKVQHAAIGIIEGKSLMGPITRFVAIKPNKVFWDHWQEVYVLHCKT